MPSEQDRVELLRRVFDPAAPGSDEVVLGIGDDAAILDPGTYPLVLTVDAAVEDVHFRRAWLSLFDIGWRSFMAAASDLAAMGAKPRGALSALVLPGEFTDDDLEALARGQAAAAAAAGTRIVGGNLARGRELSITTTLLGEAPFALRRDGARVRDAVWLGGSCGWARAGIELLRTERSDAPFAERALAAYRRPEALLTAGAAAAGPAHAAIDISDGLALDASRVAAASGVRIVLDERLLSEAAGPELESLARALGIDLLDLVLHGGDDYALLVTADPDERLPPPFRKIGWCERGADIALRRADGSIAELAPRGFDHFASR